MKTPVEIEFHGVNPAEPIRDAVAKHVAELESRFGRLTACRVLVKSPGAHHRSGGLYEVNIHLSLPTDGKSPSAARQRPTNDWPISHLR